MKTPIDQHGQPINFAFNANRRLERNISELLGLAKGVLSDGVVDEKEINFINNWVLAHSEHVNIWPLNILHQRLKKIFKDKIISEGEQRDLKQLFEELVGGKTGLIGNQDTTTSLPFDKPFPKIIFKNHIFVFTGKFAFGPRLSCENFTITAGGICEEKPTTRTSYLIIGTFGSRDWVQTSHGRKIETVVKLKLNGQKIYIISEDCWAASLPKDLFK